MQPIREKTKVLMAKLHTVSGVDPVPTAATDYIVTSNLSIEPYGGESVSLETDKPGFGNDIQIITGAMVKIEFDMFLTGTTAKDTAPGYGAVVRACAHDENITVTTGPVVYTPVSLGAAMDEVAFYFNHAGEQQIILGSRGSTNLKISGGIPMIHYSGIGIYARPTAVVMYAGLDDALFVQPQPVNKANTPTVSVFGYAATLESFEFTQNAEVEYVNLPGLESVEIGDRKPSFNMTILAPALADHDFYADVESHAAVTTGVIQVAHGSAATNRFTFDAPKVQLTGLSVTSVKGLRAYQLQGNCLPSLAGNDDYSFTVTGP